MAPRGHNIIHNIISSEMSSSSGNRRIINRAVTYIIKTSEIILTGVKMLRAVSVVR